MPTTIHDKFASILAEIERTGSANTQRLTVLKKWFEPGDRLRAFACWMIERIAAEQQASSRSSEAEALITEAGIALHATDSTGTPHWVGMQRLLRRLKAFQSEYRRVKSYQVRIIHDRSVLLLEEAFRIILRQADQPADGYRLAAGYCEHHDGRYGTNLNGPAKARVQAIADFVAEQEAREAKAQGLSASLGV